VALSSSPTTLPDIPASEETVESRPIIGVDAAAIGLRRKAPVVQSRIIKPLVSADVNGVTVALDDVGAGTMPKLFSKKPNMEVGIGHCHLLPSPRQHWVCKCRWW